MVSFLEALYALIPLAFIAAIVLHVKGQRSAARWLGLAGVVVALLAVALYWYLGSSAEGTASAEPVEPSPSFRNVVSPTAYVGDAQCATCHVSAASAYRQHAMASSFHP